MVGFTFSHCIIMRLHLHTGAAGSIYLASGVTCHMAILLWQQNTFMCCLQLTDIARSSNMRRCLPMPSSRS